jgi:signal-transduction protein with cAMP-binding, CBS, and nucleotidyltransferase domain
MGLELNSKMLVREAMSSPVISILEDKSVIDIAELMKDYKVGAIIVLNKDQNPVGIVTEHDIVTRVVALDLNLREVKAKNIMSSPLKMIEPDMVLMDAMQLMDRMKIRRLGVSYKGKLEGIISDRDIIRLVPTIVELIKEHREINRNTPFGPSTVGYCARCEMYSMNLRAVDGEFLCEDCRIEEP